MPNFDHHNGKLVEKVTKNKVTFEDGSVLEIPGVMKEVKGMVLLRTTPITQSGQDGEQLVFGHSTGNGPANEMLSVFVPYPPEAEQVDDDPDQTEGTDAAVAPTGLHHGAIEGDVPAEAPESDSEGTDASS